MFGEVEMRLEKSIEQSVCKHAKEKYKMLAIKVSGTYVGMPDRMFITERGFIFYIEFKSSVGSLNEKQKRMITKLRESNQKVFVVNDAKAGRALIDFIRLLECNTLFHVEERFINSKLKNKELFYGIW